MRKLSVYIEINGESVYVGEIVGKDSNDACFSYADTYLENSNHQAISIGLPLEEKTFNAQRTRVFFEGLLPEGSTRRCVAEWMHKDESDYISILAGLGCECLGAIKIVDESDETMKTEYRELSPKEVYALASEGATESAELVTKSHLSLTGASGKVGLYFDKEEGKWYLPIGEAPSTHIVKQSHVRLKKIVSNEQLCLMTAKNLGIDVPEIYSEDLKSVRLAPAYDIVSTMIYESSTENMALSINGVCNINEISRESFEKMTGKIGIGSKMAMKRFDTMVKGFADAINQAKEELKKQGFHQAEEICEMIMRKGGIKKEIYK